MPQVKLNNRLVKLPNMYNNFPKSITYQVTCYEIWVTLSPFESYISSLKCQLQSSRLLVSYNWLVDDSFNPFNTYFLHRFNLAQNLKNYWHYTNLLLIRCLFKVCYGCRKYLQSIQGTRNQSNVLAYLSNVGLEAKQINFLKGFLYYQVQ